MKTATKIFSTEEVIKLLTRRNRDIKSILTNPENYIAIHRASEEVLSSIGSILDMWNRPMNAIVAAYNACFKDNDELVYSNHPYFRSLKTEAAESVIDMYNEACEIVSNMPESELDAIYQE